MISLIFRRESMGYPFLKVRPFLCLALAGGLLSSAACQKKLEAPLFDASLAVGSGNGQSFSGSDFFVNVVPPTGVTVVSHRDDDWTVPCKISGTETNKDRTCLIEVNELDLFYNGLNLSYQFPAEMCSYAEFRPYYYYQWKPGKGPTNFTVNLTNGLFTSGTQANSDGTNPAMSSPTMSCDYDYTLLHGPNCCTGKYSSTISNVINPVPATGHPPPVVQTNVAWGGLTSKCLGGPAMDSQPKTASGFPKFNIAFLSGITLNDSYEIKSPISKGHASNVHVANYFTDYATYYSQTLSNPPKAFKTPGTFTPEELPTQPWYEFRCLDHNAEINNRIIVLVRSWSTASEFALKNNPSVFGSQGAPFNFDDLLDFKTWVLNSPRGFFNDYPSGSN